MCRRRRVFAWSPSLSLSSTTQPNPTHTISRATTYVIGTMINKRVALALVVTLSIMTTFFLVTRYDQQQQLKHVVAHHQPPISAQLGHHALIDAIEPSTPTPKLPSYLQQPPRIAPRPVVFNDTWLIEYRKLHKSILERSSRRKMFVYSCPGGCGGLGDRIMGITNTLAFSVLADRAFMIMQQDAQFVCVASLISRSLWCLLIGLAWLDRGAPVRLGRDARHEHALHAIDTAR